MSASTWNEWLRASLPARRCFVGFDGFTDEIVRVVRSRESNSHFTPIGTISECAQRIAAMAGTSGNLELVTTEVRLGGNAPIVASALAELGSEIVLAGAVGHPIEPVFISLVEQCLRVYPLCGSGHTHALEFSDGKILLGKMGGLNELTYERLTSSITEEQLVRELELADLFISANWTMLPHMNEIWRELGRRILPQLTKRSRWLFVDLADTKKRSQAHLQEALQLLSDFASTYRVVLGLNEAEAHQVFAALFELKSVPDSFRDLASELQRATGLAQVVIHTNREATVATQEGSWSEASLYCEQPVRTTGAGDHFNAGFCFGLLHERSARECLTLASQVVGHFVRCGASPSLALLANL